MASSFRIRQNITFILLLIIIELNAIPLSHASDGLRGIFVSKIYKQLKTHQYDKAIIKCKKLRKRHLYVDYSYFLEGVAFYLKKDYPAASERFTSAIDLNRKRGDAYYFRSSCYLNLNRITDALNDINHAIGIRETPAILAKVNKTLGFSSSEAGTKADMFLLRSRIFYAQKQLKTALKDINYSISISPHPFWLYFFHRGHIYFNQKEYKLAYRDFHETVKLNPKVINAWNTMGVIAFFMGKYKLDINVCRKALELAPGNLAGLMNLGLAYWLDGNHEKGLNLMKKVVQKQKNPIAYFHLAYFYHVDGKQDMALENYKKAVELNSDILKIRAAYLQKTPQSSPTNKFYREQFKIAKVYIETGKTPKALEFENRTAEITAIELRLIPDPVPVNKPFDIGVSFKVEMTGDETVIPVLFSFTISQNNKVLFRSESSMIEADNGRITHWNAHMNPVPVKGTYTIRGIFRYKKTAAEKTVVLTIE